MHPGIGHVPTLGPLEVPSTKLKLVIFNENCLFTMKEKKDDGHDTNGENEIIVGFICSTRCCDFSDESMSTHGRFRENAPLTLG